MKELIANLKKKQAKEILDLISEIDNMTDHAHTTMDANMFFSSALQMVLKTTSSYFNAGAASMLFRLSDANAKPDFQNINPDGNFLKGNIDYYYLNEKILTSLDGVFNETTKNDYFNGLKIFFKVISEDEEFNYVMNGQNVLLAYPNFRYLSKLTTDSGNNLLAPDYLFYILLEYHISKQEKYMNKTFPQFFVYVLAPILSSAYHNPVFLLSFGDFLLPKEYDVKLSKKSKILLEKEIPFYLNYMKTKKEFGEGHTRQEVLEYLKENGITQQLNQEERLSIARECNLPSPFSKYDIMVFDIYRRLISSIIIKTYYIFKLKTAIDEKNKAYADRLKLEDQIKRYEAVRVQMKRGQEDAHEEKNMLKPIKVGVDMLNETVAKDVWTEEDRNEIKELTSLVSKSVNKFLEYKKNLARLGNTTKPRENRDFTIDTLIERIQKDYASSLYRYNIQLKTEILQNPTIYADPNVLYENIFRNIVQNVIDHSQAKNMTIKVDKTTRISIDEKLREYCLITIEDDGVGMNEELKKDIFIPLITKDLENKGVGQGGLGCSVALETAALYNGDIEVDSESGKGTTFKIYLPLKQPKNE